MSQLKVVSQLAENKESEFYPAGPEHRGPESDEFGSVSDLELIDRAKRGDPAGFDELIRRYYRVAYAFAYRLSGEASEAEDVTQDALLRVARSIRQFQGKSRFSTWLYRIVMNVSYDMMNKKKEQRLACSNVRDELKSSPPIDYEISQDIMAGLAQLTRAEREAVVLTVYEDLTHAQAAEVLGCAETTVSWRMFRARGKLKKFFTAS
jgi:RNA polymerase sigma-70 factor (ECF subfamily)